MPNKTQFLVSLGRLLPFRNFNPVFKRKTFSLKANISMFKRKTFPVKINISMKREYGPSLLKNCWVVIYSVSEFRRFVWYTSKGEKDQWKSIERRGKVFRVWGKGNKIGFYYTFGSKIGGVTKSEVTHGGTHIHVTCTIICTKKRVIGQKPGRLNNSG